MNRFFGLRKIAPLVEGYMLPAGAFNPSGGWSHTYRIFTLASSRLTSQGTLALRRVPKSGGESELDIRIERPTLSGFSHFTHAVMSCMGNELATPLRWRVTTKIAQGEAERGYLFSEMTKEVRFHEGALVFTCGTMVERVAVAGLHTCRYNLLESLQRIVPEQFSGVGFSCMDEMDEPTPGHRLTYRETVPVALGNGTVPLRLFHHTGSGLVPAEYWVGPQGRLLFFVSGIEVLVLEEEDGTKIDYRKDVQVFTEAAQRVGAKAARRKR